MNKLLILLTLILMPFLSIKANDFVSTESNSVHEIVSEKEPYTQINALAQATYIYIVGLE